MTVVPLHRCACGAVGLPHILTWGDVTTTIFACDRCTTRSSKLMDQVRPVFAAMIACGIPNDIANDTMTFMLDALPDDDKP